MPRLPPSRRPVPPVLPKRFPTTWPLPAPQLPDSRALVAMTNTMLQGFTTHVYLFDPNGNLLEDGSATMNPPELDALEKSMDPKAPKATGTQIELSDISKQFLDISKKA